MGLIDYEPLTSVVHAQSLLDGNGNLDRGVGSLGRTMSSRQDTHDCPAFDCRDRRNNYTRPFLGSFLKPAWPLFVPKMGIVDDRTGGWFAQRH